MVVVTGPCFDDYQQVFCNFNNSLGGISPEAITLDSRRVLCVVPQLSFIGRSTFSLSLVQNHTTITESQRRNFYSCKCIERCYYEHAYKAILMSTDTQSKIYLNKIGYFPQNCQNKNSYSINFSL